MSDKAAVQAVQQVLDTHVLVSLDITEDDLQAVAGPGPDDGSDKRGV